MNICANFDILFYLSHPRNKYAEQTLFEINTMLYLAELLSIYDGCNAQKWGYGFARNKYGAPVSIELMEEVEFLCAKGYLSKDSSGYYRISDTASLNSILSISKSGILGWRSKYIEVVFDSLLTKSFPRVVRAVQNEPGISLCNGVQREHNKKLNNGLPILHKVPPKRDYGRYFCIMAEKGGTSHGGLTEKLSPFFHAKKQEVNAYGR